jgi:hypothetical protein
MVFLVVPRAMGVFDIGFVLANYAVIKFMT